MQPQDDQDNPAVSLIRAKVSSLYEDEPNFEKEISEVEAVGPHSKHQQYMQHLLSSGKSFADIQVAWHDYYQQLPDEEKREVWDEFYANQARARQSDKAPVTEQIIESHSHPENSVKKGALRHHKKLPKVKHPESFAEAKQKIKSTITADGRLTKKQHLKSLLFGVSLSGVVGIVLLFTMFNQVFLAPFITPSRSASATPLIADSSGQVGPEPKIIIPKLNLEAPLVLDLPDNREDTIQEGLEKGVTLYPNTGKPGEIANPTIFGHSSNNIFNGGDYKFVFVRLNQLENGDTFFINYNSKQYAYRVFDKKIVKPTQVDVLTERPKPSMATLITCDPPGTSTNRLVIHGEQISPDPSDNTATSIPSDQPAPAIIPSDAESLFQRFLNWF